MKAVRVHSTGGPEALRVDDLPVPSPGPGQVLVQVGAVGVNFIDVYHRTGLYPRDLPFILGSEVAGTVTAIGPGVSAVKTGDRVATTDATGAYAEYTLVAADRLVPLPEGVSTRVGAAVMLQGMTAQYLVSSTYPLGQGATCLVHAAAGGLGLLLCQMAKHRGARVIGTVSTAEKAQLAREAGADEVILYTQTDFQAELQRITGGAGVQVIYDSVGRTTFMKGLDCLARRGMMVLMGQSSGPVEPFDPRLLSQKGSLFLTRPTLGHYITSRAELLERSSEVLGGVADGTLAVHIGREFPLTEAQTAHRELESRRTMGKLLLIP
ncbi:MAG TPA: quinone oxidoreductase [Gemmatimonadales bacterium]|nr:quinone oxidoreductase [Gemmatimonadales bacterium]